MLGNNSHECGKLSVVIYINKTQVFFELRNLYRFKVQSNLCKLQS